MMNGEISVESKVNVGSVFTIRIPQGSTGSGVLGKELAQSLEKFKLNGTKQMKRAQIAFEPMPYGRILIVDDVESNLYVATGLMAPYGLNVETVMSGYDAIDKIKKGNVYDIVFMDHMMPGMDGIEATKNIRELGYTPPIVALTANAVVGQSDIFLAHGFDGFISKPIDIRQLNATLKQYVRDKQSPEVIEAARLQNQGKQAAAAQPPSLNPHFAEVFVRDAVKAAAILESIYEKRDACTDEDIHLYTINIHGMKSALINVGEKELSETAFKLEIASRDRSTLVIFDETPAFLVKLREVIEKLSVKKEGETGPADSEEARSLLREKLLAVKEACGVFDKKTAKNTINDLRQKTWPKETGDLLGAIAEHLLNGDFEEASKAAEKIIQTL
jgi:CheY-like chemotaxis protein